jgi:hypothetical protein
VAGESWWGGIWCVRVLARQRRPWWASRLWQSGRARPGRHRGRSLSPTTARGGSGSTGGAGGAGASGADNGANGSADSGGAGGNAPTGPSARRGGGGGGGSFDSDGGGGGGGGGAGFGPTGTTSQNASRSGDGLVTITSDPDTSGCRLRTTKGRFANVDGLSPNAPAPLGLRVRGRRGGRSSATSPVGWPIKGRRPNRSLYVHRSSPHARPRRLGRARGVIRRGGGMAPQRRRLESPVPKTSPRT